MSVGNLNPLSGQQLAAIMFRDENRVLTRIRRTLQHNHIRSAHKLRDNINTVYVLGHISRRSPPPVTPLVAAISRQSDRVKTRIRSDGDRAQRLAWTVEAMTCTLPLEPWKATLTNAEVLRTTPGGKTSAWRQHSEALGLTVGAERKVHAEETSNPKSVYRFVMQGVLR